MKNAGGFLAGILGGAIVGAAIGMLFAPEKGEDTRAKIADAFEDTKGKVAESVDKVMEALKKRGVTLTKTEVEDLVDELRAKVETKFDE